MTAIIQALPRVCRHRQRFPDTITVQALRNTQLLALEWTLRVHPVIRTLSEEQKAIGSVHNSNLHENLTVKKSL